MSIKAHPPLHVPVLLEAVLAQLQPRPGERYLDLTAGYGGHATAILEQTQTYTTACLVDRDQYALSQLGSLAGQGARLMHCDFLHAAQQLVREGEQFDLLLLDLGVSSPQLDRADRGFSFTHTGPLDMRMDQRQAMTAEQIVNHMAEAELARLITRYGEEPPAIARRYAAAICAARPLSSTGELARIIEHATCGKRGKTHPATRTFQAVRIAVNDELTQIEQTLQLVPALLRTGGRVGVISFHSLEDRLVKRFFAEQRQAGYEAELRILTKKPIAGSHDDAYNPRARSAKLRAAAKI